MAYGKDRITYTLYLDAADTQVWGDGTSSSQLTVCPTVNTEISVPIHGRLFADQKGYGRRRSGQRVRPCHLLTA